MWDATHDHESQSAERGYGGPLLFASLAWAVGLGVGSHWRATTVWLWMGGALLATSLVLACLRRSRASRAVVLLALVFTAAAWWGIRIPESQEWGLSDNAPIVLGVEKIGSLARIEGVVEDDIQVRTSSNGLLGRFDYRAGYTTFTLETVRADLGDGLQPRRGRVRVTLPETGLTIEPGDLVVCSGWLRPEPPPDNPGERDKQLLARRDGVIGRLTLSTVGNCETITPAPQRLNPIARAQRTLKGRASNALGEGFDEPASSDALGFLRILLLNDWRGETRETQRHFKEAGLTHALVISGMHLAIIAAGTWYVLRIVSGRPRIATLGSVFLVGLFMLVIPPGVAVVRAGIMAALAWASMTVGFRLTALNALGAAAMLIFIWRPQDLYNPGFQLSFVVVAYLILAVPRVTGWFARENPLALDSPLYHARRSLAAFFAVSLIAWCASAPLLAHHFGAVTPIGILATAATLPLITLILWLGYAKIALGLILPDASAALAEPLTLLSDATLALARWGAELPGSQMLIPRPGFLWVLLTMAFLALLFAGAFARHKKWAALVLVALVLRPALPAAHELLVSRYSDRALTLDMFSVGNGSCYLLRSGGHTAIFDCGSGGYIDITTSTIGPALRALGVTSIDTLYISHPDMDHYSGALELIDSFSVHRVVLGEAFGRDAAENPTKAAGYFREQIRERGVQVIEASAGWSDFLGQTRAKTLWPPAGASTSSDNNASLVLRLEAAGKSILLTGDIQDEAVTRILADPASRASLDADILELPHHGARLTHASKLMDAVSPTIILQSTSHSRLITDSWPPHLGESQRFITAIHGATQVTIHRDGTITATPTFPSRED